MEGRTHARQKSINSTDDWQAASDAEHHTYQGIATMDAADAMVTPGVSQHEE
jgi:hypothetical protein